MSSRVQAFIVIAASLVVACGKDPEVAKREFVRNGDAYVAQGKLPEAIIEYRNAVKQDGMYGDARKKLAELYIKTGDWSNGLQQAVRAADLLPQDFQAQLQAGTMLLGVHQFDEALDRANNALAIQSKSVDAQILRANALAGLRKIDEAIADVEEAIRLDPDRVNSYASLGLMQVARGNRAEAEAAFKRAINQAPKSAEARLALAGYYWSIRDVTAAEEQLKIAFELDPNSLLAHRAMAILYMDTGKRKNAEPHLVAIANAASVPGPKLLLADYYRTMQRLNDARKVLDGIVAANGAGFAEAKIRLAGMGFAGKDAAGAMKAIDEALAKEPANAEALVGKGQLLAKAGDMEGAFKAIAAAAQSNPRSAMVQFALARTQSARGHHAEAQTAYVEALKLNPNLVDAEVELAKIHLAAGRLSTAEEFVTSAVAKFPGHVEAHILRARVYLMKGDAKKAEPWVRGLARVLPNSPSVQAELGQLELLKKNRPAARAAFQKALAANPGQLDALGGLITMDLQDKRPDQAKARVDSAVQRAPKNGALLVVAATTYSSLGDKANAEKLARRALDVDPDNTGAHSLLGQIFTASHRVDEAIAQYTELVKKAPSSIEGHTSLGMLYQMQNKPAEAKAAYERALDADPRAVVAANNLAWMVSDSGGNADIALQFAQKAYAGMPDQPNVSDTLGWMYYKKNRFSEAIPPLETAVKKAPTKPEYHYHLGLAQAGLGESAKAQASLQTALKLSANFAGAEDARKKLAELRP